MLRTRPGRRVSAAEAVSHIPKGATVYVHGMCQTPTALLEAVAARARTVPGIRLVHMHLEGPAPHLAPDLAGRLEDVSLFVGKNTREAVAEGRAQYLPVYLSQVPRLIRDRIIPVNTVFLQVSPPGPHGLVSLGMSVEAVRSAVQAAERVIALVNPHVPWVGGDGLLRLDEIDDLVEVDEPLPYHPSAPVREEAVAIGRHIAELIDDGDTLQLGIGAISDGVFAALQSHRDLGLHTETFSDSAIPLLERGVITGRFKTVDRGLAVASFLTGSQALRDYVHRHPGIMLRDIDYTNDPAVIARQHRMVSINAAVQVDLTGQVCAESVGPATLSGVGGQMDFFRGAVDAPGGRAILALPSTARNGTVSRIVSTLTPGSVVTTPRPVIQYVVTEFGVAHLEGKTLSERARALLAIAHPRFQETLEREAMELGLLPRIYAASTERRAEDQPAPSP